MVRWGRYNGYHGYHGYHSRHSNIHLTMNEVSRGSSIQTMGRAGKREILEMPYLEKNECFRDRSFLTGRREREYNTNYMFHSAQLRLHNRWVRRNVSISNISC